MKKARIYFPIVIMLFIGMIFTGCGDSTKAEGDDPNFFDGSYAMNEMFTLADIQIIVTKTDDSSITASAGKRAIEVTVKYSADKTMSLGNVSAKTADGKSLMNLTAGAQDSMSFRNGGEYGFATFALPQDRTEFAMYFKVSGYTAVVRIETKLVSYK